MKTEDPRKIGIVLCLLIFSVACFSAQSPTPVAPEHPRLLFKTSLYPQGIEPETVASRVEKLPYSTWYSRLDLESFHTAALSWLIRSGRGESQGADSVADSVVARMLALPLREGNFYNGENLHRMSLAYDWLYHYPGFTPEKKRAVREKMLAMAEKLISKSVRDIIWGEEIFHNYCSNAGLAVGLTGLALYEGPQDKEAARLIRIAEDWYHNRAFPGMALLEGGWHEGMAYSLNHVLQETPIWVAAYRSATGIDYFARIKREQGNWMEGWIYFCLANIRPDYTFVRSGDNGATRMLPDRTLRQALELIVSAYGNRHGKFLLDELESRLGERAISSGDLWMPLIFYDDSLQTVDYRELAPTQIINPGRLGHVYMRSGWGPDDTFVHFECGDYFGSHNHLDQNQFTIYHKGSLALDSGYYDNYSPHHMKYAYRAIAHNVVLVHDPEELVYPSHGDPYPSPGGQRSLDKFFRNSNYELSVFWNQYRDNAYADAGDIVAWESTAGYDYVAGDATSAYNSTRAKEPGARPKISRCVRRLLFVKPDLVAVCDNVDALDPAFEKSWLLHTVNEPAIGESGLVTVTEKLGRLILSPLLPADVRVEKVGGPGREFMVNGENQPIVDRKWVNGPAEPGSWRLELKPGAPREKDIFLNLMELGDAGASLKYNFKLLENEKLVGAAAKDIAVLFTRDREPGAPVPESIALPEGIAPGSRVFIAGLEKNGIYRVQGLDNKLNTFSAGPGGVLEIKPGERFTGSITLSIVK
ncbi:MAG TPA: heparinase II/III family protein [archaeon]|nr:heparinase II/III family protein [archaeon]